MYSERNALMPKYDIYYHGSGGGGRRDADKKKERKKEKGVNIHTPPAFFLHLSPCACVRALCMLYYTRRYITRVYTRIIHAPNACVCVFYNSINVVFFFSPLFSFLYRREKEASSPAPLPSCSARARVYVYACAATFLFPFTRIRTTSTMTTTTTTRYDQWTAITI